MTCWPPFSRQRNKASGQSLRLQWRTFAADIMAVRLQNSNRRNDVCHYRSVYSRPSRLRRDYIAPAYITSVFIGYIGTDSDWFAYQTLRCCAGVEDGRNQ